jgi:ferredoxin
MDHVRFPYLHPVRLVDMSHERFVVDHNRCILCARCVRVCHEIEGAHTWDIEGRGVEARIISDLDQPWGESQTCTWCGKCINVCPTGALVEKGKPAGEMVKRERVPALPDQNARSISVMSKKKVATLWLDGCSGCHMSLFDLDERLLDLAEHIDRSTARWSITRNIPEGVDIALIEGAVSYDEDLEKLHKVRARTKILVAFGDCAVAGNVPTMRNPFKVAEVMERAFIETADVNPMLPARVIARPYCPTSSPFMRS